MVLGPGMVESRGGQTPAVNTESLRKTWLSKLAIPVRKKYYEFCKRNLAVCVDSVEWYIYTTRGMIEYVPVPVHYCDTILTQNVLLYFPVSISVSRVEFWETEPISFWVPSRPMDSWLRCNSHNNIAFQPTYSLHGFPSK